jgi:hypothetical protein
MGKEEKINKVKVKIIQGMIQIERPSNWSITNIIKIANEIKSIEIIQRTLKSNYQNKDYITINKIKSTIE